MPRYKLILEYDGTGLVGWQRQANGLSVQEILEISAEHFCGQRLVVHGAGRTDSGVHALGQVAHIDLPKEYPTDVIRNALNQHVKPHAVSVVAVGSGGRGYGSAGGGGGELCYQNAIAVTPGATMQVVVGDLFSTIAGGHDSSFGALVAHGGSDAESSPPGGILGGTGGTVGTCFAGGRGSYNASAGGAAGYAGVGGNAAIDVHPVQNGAGGGGGGPLGGAGCQRRESGAAA